MSARLAGWGLAALLAGCAAPAPAQPTWALGTAGPIAGAPAGEVAGRAFAWRGDGFVPLAGAAIALDGVPTGQATDAAGAFRLAGVVPGEHVLAAAALGLEAAPVHVHPDAAGGVAGVALLAWVPTAGPVGRGDRRVVGVATDPRGAALPGATIHCVDDVSAGGAGGNRRWTADADGLFTGVLPGATAVGTASLMAYGRLADGRPAEGRFRKVLPLAGGVEGVAVATHAIGGGEGPVNASSR